MQYINGERFNELRNDGLVVNRNESKKMKTGYASIDKPWMKWHEEGSDLLEISDDNFYDYFMQETCFYPSSTILLDILNLKGYTRSDIEHEVKKQIKMFTNLGIKEGDTVSFMMLSVPEVIFMFLALNKMGAIANLIKFDESPERINYMLNLTNSKYFFVNDIDFMISNSKKVLELNNNLEKIITIPVMESIENSKTKGFEIKKRINELVLKTHKYPKEQAEELKEFEELEKLKKELSREDINSKIISYATYKNVYLKDAAVKLIRKGSSKTTLIVYTGGSTGDAKGVELTNKNLVAMAHGLKNSNYGFTYGKTSMNILPPAIAYYLNATCGLMICGVKVTQIPMFEIEKYAELVDTYKPNIIFSGPILLKILAASNIKDFSYLSSPASGGDKLHVEEEMFINSELNKKGAGNVQQGYGSSEETAVATCNPYDKRKVGSIGIPMSDVIVSIFDYQTDKEIPYGKNLQGEICITGPTVMKGYLNNQEATDYVLRLHSDGRIWAHTDDFGVMDEDGFIYHKGRAKRMLTRSGTKLWLPSLEEEIQKLNLIKECCAVKLDDEVEREVPVVHVVLKDDSSEDVIYQIDEYIKNNCPSNYRPKYYILKSELPYTEVNKKLDFKTLEKENILDEDNFIINGIIIKPRVKVKKIV